MSAQVDREVLAYAFSGARLVAEAFDESIVQDWQRSDTLDVELTDLGEERMRGYEDDRDDREFRTDVPTGLPPAFATWPREDQLAYLVMRKSRRDLMAHLLSRAGFAHEEIGDLEHDRKLTKKELAGIYRVVEGLN